MTMDAEQEDLHSVNNSDADHQTAGGDVAIAEEPEAEVPPTIPQSTYSVVPSAPDPEDPEPLGPVVEVPNEEPAPEEPPKPAVNMTNIYIAGVAAIGLLAGVGVAANLRAKAPSAPNNFGVVTADAYGLKGRLTTKWEDKLSYRLTIEPRDAKQQPGFDLAVSSSPRPLQMVVQLKDALGFVLCSNTILLKYDTRKAVAFAASLRDSESLEAANSPGNQIAMGIDIARLENQEIDREHGRDVFQNDIGQNGQIASISAQGEIPCSKKDYESAVSWIFLPDFPTLTQQTDWLNHRPGLTPVEDTSPLSADSVVSALIAQAPAKKAKRKVPASVSAFYVEGDDTMVGYDPATGMIETSTGKLFKVDKTSAEAATLKNADFPINFHFKCDQGSICRLTSAGAGNLNAIRKK